MEKRFGGPSEPSGATTALLFDDSLFAERLLPPRGFRRVPGNGNRTVASVVAEEAVISALYAFKAVMASMTLGSTQPTLLQAVPCDALVDYLALRPRVEHEPSAGKIGKVCETAHALDVAAEERA